jgi:hypothetical protein
MFIAAINNNKFKKNTKQILKITKQQYIKYSGYKRHEPRTVFRSCH